MAKTTTRYSSNCLRAYLDDFLRLVASLRRWTGWTCRHLSFSTKSFFAGGSRGQARRLDLLVRIRHPSTERPL